MVTDMMAEVEQRRHIGGEPDIYLRVLLRMIHFRIGSQEDAKAVQVLDILLPGVSCLQISPAS